MSIRPVVQSNPVWEVVVGRNKSFFRTQGEAVKYVGQTMRFAKGEVRRDCLNAIDSLVWKGYRFVRIGG